MDIIFSIDDQLTENFSEGARQELERQSKKIVKDLIDEAIVLEKTRRGADAKPEIIQTDVLAAALFPRFVDNKKKPWWKKVLQAAVAVLSFIPGFIYSCDTFLSDMIILIIVIIVIALIVYLIAD